MQEETVIKIRKKYKVQFLDDKLPPIYIYSKIYKDLCRTYEDIF